MASTLADPYFSLYVLALGGSYFDISLTSAVGNLLMLIPIFFAGSLTDVVGRKRLVVFFGFLLTAIYILFSQAPSWEFLLIGQALNFLINGFRGPAFSAILADSTNPEDRVFALALWQRIPQVMTLISPFIGGLIIDRLGIVQAMRIFYLITFFTCLIAQLLRYKYLKETVPRINGAVFRTLKSAIIEIKELPSKIPRQVLYIIGINGLLSFAASIPASYWVIYATTDIIGLTASEWGLSTTVHTIIMIVFTIIFSLLANKFGRTKNIIVSLIVTPFIVILFPFSNNITEILILRIALSLAMSLRSAALSAIFIDYSPKFFRGRINALQRLATRPMAVFGSLLGGYLYQDYSKSSPFFVNALVIGAAGITFLLLIKEPSQYEE
jgi:MFS family permease